ncbi:D-alanyl-D-alanine carboxypeptidase [Streptomyces sp. NPDC058045]|uniref:D-alanyl-D-alanine carboxypeptidase n=1 Tax=Streptomyces sp. NPDC058045 TaxID=3346311 RepID=UPI0036EE19EF
MEEVPVAGESPDRSKKQESSGSPSTAPAQVPSPSSEDRDPRLAVARESRGRVDQPTAVFSTAGMRGGTPEAAEPEPSAEAEHESTPERTPDAPATVASTADSSTADSESPAADEAEPGADAADRDARLRAAVAAWIGRDGDGADTADAADAPESGAGDADADGSSGAGDGAARSGLPVRTRTKPDAEEKAEPAEKPEPVAADEPEKSEDPEKAEEPEKAEKAESSGTGESSDADESSDSDDGADEAESADRSEESAASKNPETTEEAEETEETEESGKSDSDDKAEKADKPEKNDKTEKSEKSEKADEAEESGKPEESEKVNSAEVAGSSAESAESEPDEDGESGRVDTATAVFRTPKSVAVDEPASKPKLDGTPADDSAEADDEAEPDDTSEAKDTAKDTAKTEEPAPKSETAKSEAPKAEKATPKSETAKPKAEASETEAAKAEAAGEVSAAERTSRFVALKPLDEGAPPKPPERTGSPQPAAEAPAPVPAGPAPVAEPTTQQPLPPLPPMDLLAELTNTPPPPETALRTAVRRVKIWTPLVILVITALGVVQAVRPLPDPKLTLTAAESYGFDGSRVSLPWPDEGQGWMDVAGLGTMDHFGKQTPVPVGSVAKMMTAYVVLQDHPLKRGASGPGITVDALAEKEGGYDSMQESTLNTIKEGDTLTEKQALAAIMVPSANNVARLLARWDAGSEKAFVAKMNAAAKKLGMENTRYTDPSGLDHTTVSTAEDQVKLGNELVQIPALVEVTKLPAWKDPSGKTWSNYNRLVPYDGAIGLKTGTTTKAGGNLVFAATKEVGGERVTVVGAVLGQHKTPIIDTVNAVSKTAMLAARDALTSRTVLKKGDVVGYVDDGLGGHTPVVATEKVSAVGWPGVTVHLKLNDGGKTIPHKAKAGTEVGSLTVGDGSDDPGGAVRVPIALQQDLTEPGYAAKATRLG